MARGKKGRKGKRREGKGLSENIDTDFLGGEVTLGWEKAGIGAAVTFSEDTVTVSLGIGVAAVELDLGELNNSKVSYAFDLYEIEGYRDGCTVTLEYRIAGVTVKTETRKIPDCEDEKEQDRGDDARNELPDDEIFDPDLDRIIRDIPGNLNDRGFWLVGGEGHTFWIYNRWWHSWWYEVRESRSKGTSTGGNIYKDEQNHFKANAFNSRSRSGQTFDRDGDGFLTLDQDTVFSENSTSEQVDISAVGASTALGYNYYNTGGWSPKAVLLAGLKWQVIAFVKQQTRTFKAVPARESFEGDDIDPYKYGIGNGYETARVLDAIILEKGLPTRKGVNGIQSEKTRRKREKPMDKKCCQMIAEIYDVLAPDEMIDEGFNIPTSLYTPNGRGNKRLNNYMQVLDYLYRAIAHFGIGPFTWKLKDSNLAKEGNQELKGQTINGTDAAREILQSVKKGSSENEGLITATGSIMIALEQIATITTEGTRVVREIFQFLGIPIKSETFKIKLPFNTKALYNKITKRGRGKDKKSNQTSYELNTTEPSNTLLPKMLTQNEREYELEVYDDNYPNLIEQITSNQINNNANN
ncbi:MAG: hypothetical protein AAGJ08_01845 [Cyanobacteria bacterium P01_H01_bin.35]